MTRKEFLSSTWKRYPILPKGDFFVGRVVEIERERKGFSVSLERNSQVSVHRYLQLNMFESAPVQDPAIEALSVLMVGDLVAIAESGTVHLLAPQLTAVRQKSFDVGVLHLWQEYIYWLNQFFREKGFLHVATPSLVPCPGTEPTLDYFSTELQQGSKRTKFYLPTSPELHLKKALSFGAEKIFEVRTCYRNGEITQHHQPEFTMIEWYRAFASLEEIQKDVENLVVYLSVKMNGVKAPMQTKTFSVKELFAKSCGFDFSPSTTVEELRKLAKKLNVDVSSATTIDDFFFLLFMEKIEASFSPQDMIFVKDYPPYQAALARLSEQGWGERFEMYWQGLEIANAFHELNDPEIQQKRLEEDLKKKALLGKEQVPLDEEFMQSLRAGMPPSSGIALGVERLFMALTGVQKISQTRLFPMK